MFEYENDIIFHFWCLQDKIQTLTRKGAKNELLILKTLPAVNLKKKLFSLRRSLTETLGMGETFC